MVEGRWALGCAHPVQRLSRVLSMSLYKIFRQGFRIQRPRAIGLRPSTIFFSRPGTGPQPEDAGAGTRHPGRAAQGERPRASGPGRRAEAARGLC